MTETTRTSYTNSLSVLEERQRKILLRLSAYYKTTTIMGFILFVIVTAVQFIDINLIKYGIDINAISQINQISINTIIVMLFTLLANLVLCIFGIWCLSFTPYFVIQAHKSSQEISFDMGAKPFRWLQLYIATWAPLIILAIIWISTVPQQYTNNKIRISSINEALGIVAGSFAVFCALWAVNTLIPIHLVVFRLTLFSFMLYISLYLTYGLALSSVSYMTLFGFLLYLTFRAKDIENVVRRIAVYDIDPKVADELSELVRIRHQAGVGIEETRARQLRATVEHERHEQELQTAETNMKLTIRDNQIQARNARNAWVVKVSKDMLALYEEKYARLAVIVHGPARQRPPTAI